jgi:hypothetical protein
MYDGVATLPATLNLKYLNFCNDDSLKYVHLFKLKPFCLEWKLKAQYLVFLKIMLPDIFLSP